jgi:hypothetical protein
MVDIDFSITLYISDKMIINDMLKGVPLLILANKQDLEVCTLKLWDTNILKETQKNVNKYKQLEVKTNQTSFFCRNCKKDT